MSDVFEIASDWVPFPEADGETGRMPRAALLLRKLGLAWGTRHDAQGRLLVYRQDGRPVPESVVEEMAS